MRVPGDGVPGQRLSGGTASPSRSKGGEYPVSLLTIPEHGIELARMARTFFGAYGEGYLRFSIANSYDNLMTALNRISEFLVSPAGKK